MNNWYAEISTHKYGEEKITCGHFAQVVWRSTRGCGFGRAVSREGKVYVIAHYFPPGNVKGEWTANVLPAKDGRTDLAIKKQEEKEPTEEVTEEIGKYLQIFTVSEGIFFPIDVFRN